MEEIAAAPTGCSGKIIFFHYPLQPIPRLHIAARDFQSSQRNASVQLRLLRLLAGQFDQTLYSHSSPVLTRRGGKIMIFLKHTFFIEHPVLSAGERVRAMELTGRIYID